jgi:CRISPR/Cas system-associated endonuclease Cas1
MKVIRQPGTPINRLLNFAKEVKKKSQFGSIVLTNLKKR